VTTYAVQATKFLQYTGSNSAAIVALVADPEMVVTITSEVAGVLTLHVISNGGPFNGGGDDSYVIHSTDYVSSTPGSGWVQIVTAAELAASWIVKA
jgi:hypothetical protein